MTLFEKLDIDAGQLRTLFLVYFKQDFRSSRSVLRSSRTEYLSANSAVLSLVGMYVATGFLLGITAFSADAFFFSLVTLSYTFFIVAMAIIAESSNVIFNESEPDIIGHLPISSRTLFAAKVLNLFSFTFMLATAVNLVPAVCGIWAKGSNPLFPLAHFAGALSVSLFSTALVITSYGLLIRYVDKERFNNIIAYSQTALSIVFILGFQLLPQLVHRYEFSLADARPWVLFLYPPAWFSGVSMLLLGKTDALSVTLAALALAALALLVGLALRKVASGYSSFVSRLAFDGGSLPAAARASKPGSKSRVSGPVESGAFGRIKAVILRNPVERAVFDLVVIYLKRDREVKIRLYPSFGTFLVFPVLGLFSSGLSDPFVSQRFIFNALASMAMIPFIAWTAIETTIFSDHFRAAYIFRTAPVASLSDIHQGIRKAVFLFVALPAATLLLVFYAALWRSPVHALLVVLPWVLLTPAIMMMSFLRRELLPLSRRYKKGQQSARLTFLFMGGFLFFFLVGGIQSLSIGGAFPYPLFLLGVLIFAPLGYFVLHKISGESTLLRPQSISSED